jgi:adenylate cyclase
MSPDWVERSLDARILVVDDVEANVLLLQGLLRQQGYRNVHATMDPRTVMALHREQPFDLILLDLQMPHMDGFAVMDQLAAEAGGEFLPVIVVTAFSDQDNRLKALRGARDFILKPFAAAEVAQRIRNYLEVRMLYDERRREAVALEGRVREQVAQLESLSRLRRFFSAQLAERILAGGVDDPLRPHRREITAVSIDLRGFTAFTERSEPEDVMRVLHEYHSVLGRLVVAHEGTIEWFAGDGIMVILNDPVELDNPARSAVRMALEMQAALGPVAEGWRREGFDLGMGIGIAQGYATIGAIGFEGRWDYAAIGTVTNLASRLCAEAASGQIVVDLKVMRRIDDAALAEPLGELALKGFSRPVPAFSVSPLRAAHIVDVAAE